MRLLNIYIILLMYGAVLYSCSLSSANSKSKGRTGEVAGHIYSNYPFALSLPSGLVLYNNYHRYKYTITKPPNKYGDDSQPLFFFKNVKPGKYTLVVGDTTPEYKFVDIFKKERTEPAYVKNDTLKNISVGGDSTTLISYTTGPAGPSRHPSFREVKLPMSLLKTTGNIVGSFSVAKYKDIAKCKYRGAYAGIGISGYSGDSLVSRFTTSDSLGNFQLNDVPIGFYKTNASISCPEKFQRMNGELYDDFQKYETEYYKNILIQPYKVATVVFSTLSRYMYHRDPTEDPVNYAELPLKYLDQK